MGEKSNEPNSDILQFLLVEQNCNSSSTEESRFKKLQFKKELWFKKDYSYNQNIST